MVGAYIRVSSKKQEDNDSLENQTQRATAFAKAKKEKLIIYKDVESGSKADRPQWMRFKADIQSKKITTGWVNQNDRLGRDAREAIEFWNVGALANFDMYIGDKKIDWYDNNDYMMYCFVSVISEGDRRKIIKNVKEAKTIAINDGRNTFRQLYGYTFEVIGVHPTNNRPIRRWYAVPEQMKVIRLVYKMYQEKISLVKIAQKINSLGYRTQNGKYFAVRTLFHILHHVEYTSFTYDKEKNLIPSKIYKEKIIPLEDFNRVENNWKVQSSDHNIKIGRPAEHLGSGVVTCACCGIGYFFHKQQKYNSYVHNNNKKCPEQHRKVLSEIVINRLIEHIFFEALSKPKLIENDENKYDDIIQLENSITAINKRIKKLIDQLELFDDDSVSDRLIERQTEKKELVKELDRLKVQNQLSINKRVRVTMLLHKNRLSEFVQATEQNKRKMAKEVIESMIINGNQIDVTLIDGRNLVYDYETEKKNGRIKKEDEVWDMYESGIWDHAYDRKIDIDNFKSFR